MRNLLRVLSNKVRNQYHRNNLVNKEFTIISNNCIGGMVCHDLAQRFNSPTINMWIKPKYYLKFLKNIEYYLNADWTEVFDKKVKYPIVLIDNIIEVHLMHYKTIEEAKIKWDQRKERIKWDNIYFVMQEGSETSYEFLKEFNELPFENKVILTHIDYPELKSAFKVNGYEKESYVGILTDYVGFFGKHKYDDFNWVEFLNKKTK